MGWKSNCVAIILLSLLITVLCNHPGDEDTCPVIDRVLSGTGGYIESPVDPSTRKYPPNLFCAWEFDLPDDKFVSLKFTHLDVELSGGCSDDRVEIYDGKNTYERFCGDKLPRPITLAVKDRVYINFVTDDYLQFSGFRIEYEVVNNLDVTCSGLLCLNRLCAPQGSKCDGIDQCGDGTDEEGCPESSAGAELDSVPDPSCGLSSSHPISNNNPSLLIHRLIPRVVGGQVAKEGVWPWMVSLQKSYAYPSGHICGGALLNHRWVVTAAHCLTAEPMVQQKILLGSYHRYQEVEGQVTRYPSINCIHPEYKKDVGMQNDIALVKLSVPVNYSDTVSPICLPDLDTSLPSSLVVTGWGRTQGTGAHDVLKEVRVPVLPQNECGRNAEFCLIDKNGHNSPCYGDSGGPAVQYALGKWYLFGLISRGAEVCGFRSDPTVCTQVSQHLKWINDQLKANFLGKPMQCQQD